MVDEKQKQPSREAEHKKQLINKKYLFGFFFFVVFIFLLYEFLRLMLPFIDSIVLSIALTLIFFPLHKFIRKRIKNYPSLAATISVFLVLVTVGIPLTFTGVLLVKESKDLIRSAEKVIKTTPTLSEKGFQIEFKPPLDKFAKKISSVFQTLDIDVREYIFAGIKSLSGNIGNIAKSTGKIAKNFFALILDGVVLVLALFLFFRDGENITQTIIHLAPMDAKYKNAIANRLYETVVAVTRGVILTAAMQGFLAAIGYSIVGVGMPAILGILTAIAAVFPIGGATIVWLPVTIYVFLAISKGWAIFLLIWCAVLVSSLDNFIRPMLIGTRAKLPVIILVIAILGGFKVYGVRGLLVGPLLVACVIAFVQIYKQELYFTKEELPQKTKK
ncbi:MAG TPA: AI-2E family transporter [Elusimicrobiales bacterium]|nr:AI-2E family transporter [Elusimicrobiales bacterium]